MMIAVYLLMLSSAFLCWIITAISEELTCVVLTNPTIFGENLKIGCISNKIPTCLAQEFTRAWLVDGKHIFLNGAPIKGNTKYSEDVRSCNETVLVISNFSASDVDKMIRCSVREHDCIIRATPEAIHLQYLNSNMGLTKKISITTSSVEVNLSFAMVYPEPNCSFSYQGNDITNQSEVNAVNHVHYYTKHYHLKYKPEKAECPSLTKCMCQIGLQELTVVEEDFRNCTYPNPTTSELPAGLVPSVVVSVNAIVLVLQSIIRNRQHMYKLLKVVRGRSLNQLRRPVIGLVLSICLVGSLITTVIALRVEFYSPEMPALGVIFSFISCMIAVVLLCFISNPCTISIREGVKNAINKNRERFQKCFGWTLVPQ